MNLVRHGINILESPKDSSDACWELMTKCWRRWRQRRVLTAVEILEGMKKILQNMY